MEHLAKQFPGRVASSRPGRTGLSHSIGRCICSLRFRRPVRFGAGAMQCAIVAGLVTIGVAPVDAMVLGTLSDSLTTSAPTGVGNDPGWNNLSTGGSRNAIYLGDGWVLSARHV